MWWLNSPWSEDAAVPGPAVISRSFGEALPGVRDALLDAFLERHLGFEAKLLRDSGERHTVHPADRLTRVGLDNRLISNQMSNQFRQTCEGRSNASSDRDSSSRRELTIRGHEDCLHEVVDVDPIAHGVQVSPDC